MTNYSGSGTLPVNPSHPLTFLGYTWLIFLHNSVIFHLCFKTHSSVHNAFPRARLGKTVLRAHIKPIASLIIHILLLFDNYLTSRACEARGGRRLDPSYTSPGFIFSRRDEQVSLETRLMCGEVTGAAASPETQPQSLHIQQK